MIYCSNIRYRRKNCTPTHHIPVIWESYGDPLRATSLHLPSCHSELNKELLHLPHSAVVTWLPLGITPGGELPSAELVRAWIHVKEIDGSSASVASAMVFDLVRLVESGVADSTSFDSGTRIVEIIGKDLTKRPDHWHELVGDRVISNIRCVCMSKEGGVWWSTKKTGHLLYS